MALFRSFATVGGATLASRILGFVREVLLAALLGTGPVADAFYAAFNVPNLFRRFFAEGAFNSAFVPLFAKSLEERGEEGAKAFATQVFSCLAAILLIGTALLELFMPAFIDLTVPGFRSDPDKRDLTIVMARIMMPYLFCLSLVAMLSGILNTYRRYFLAAFAPILLNVILIAALSLCFVIAVGNNELIGSILAWSVLVAGIGQLLLLVVGVHGIGFRPRLVMPRLTPDVRHLLLLAGPAALSAGIVQINLFVGRIIASGKDGAISVLSYADRLYQLPLGVVGIAIGVVLLPELSRALKAGQMERVIETENRSLEFAFFLTLPAALALFLIPEQIVRALYEHGAFTAADTAIVAPVLAMFAIGLPAFILIKVFSPCYFARENTKTPMIFAAVNAGFNIIGSLALFPLYGELGIAAATSIAAWINAILLFCGLVLRGHWTIDAGLIKRVPLSCVAAAVMAAVLIGLTHLLGSWMEPQLHVLWHLGAVTVLVGAGSISYLGTAFVIGAINRAQLKAAVSRSK